MDNSIFIELGTSRLRDLVDRIYHLEINGEHSSAELLNQQAMELASALDTLGYNTLYINDLQTDFIS